MKKVILPIKRQTKGAKVGDLQDALQLLLDLGIILADEEPARGELSAVPRRERAKQRYGEATRKAVRAFQKERQLGGGGEVDEPTDRLKWKKSRRKR